VADGPRSSGPFILRRFGRPAGRLGRLGRLGRVGRRHAEARVRVNIGRTLAATVAAIWRPACTLFAQKSPGPNGFFQPVCGLASSPAGRRLQPTACWLHAPLARSSLAAPRSPTTPDLVGPRSPVPGPLHGPSHTLSNKSPAKDLHPPRTHFSGRLLATLS